jgi:hypothetical protein
MKLLLGILPAIFLLGLCGARYSRQVCNADPTYAYLLNSLLLAEFKAPHHVDHPGTTVQLLGALVIKSMNVFSSRDEMVRSVLENPMHYINAILLCLNLLQAASLFLSGFLVWKATEDIRAALLFQLAPAMMWADVNASQFINTEPMQMTIGFLLAALLIYFREKGEEKDELKFGRIFGLLLGMGIVTKIIFAPLILIPLLILGRWKSRVQFLAALLCGVAVFIIPIVGRLTYIRSWVRGLATHKGLYGRGEKGFIDHSAYWGNLVGLVRSAEFFFVAVFASALVLLWILWRRKKLEPLLFGVVVVQLLQLVLVAKMPKETYLVPAFVLSGINLVFVYRALRGDAAHRVRGWIVFSCLALIISWVAVSYQRREMAWIRGIDREHNSIEPAIAAAGTNRVVVNYFGSTSADFALFFGNQFAGHHYGKELGKVYPKTLFYELWGKRYQTFAETIEPAAVFQMAPEFLFRGVPFDGKDWRVGLEPAEFSLQEHYGGRLETFYLAVPRSGAGVTNIVPLKSPAASGQ